MDNPSTDGAQFFFPEWVSGIFYGGTWHMVKLGSFKDGIETDRGAMACYEDPFDGEIVFVMEDITGYRVKKPEILPPEEPKASVTPLFPEKE